MLPPSSMLATKNLGSVAILFPVAICAVVLTAGCSPPGTRAFLDGDRLMREGKYAPAIEKLKRATELLAEAWQPRAWNHLGLAHHQAGQANEAIVAYQQALRLSPNLAVARYNLGRLYLDQNNLPGAIAELSAYTVLDANSLPCWLKLGAALMRSKQFDEAEKCYRNALQLDASQPEALNGMGVIQLQRKRWRDGLVYFNAALEKHSRYAPALLNLAIVYHQHFPNRQLALRRYRDYLEAAPQTPNASAVEEIVRQIEAELNPPPRLTQTNQPAGPATLAQAPSPMTNAPSLRTAATSAPPLLASSTPPPKPAQPKPSPPAERPSTNSEPSSIKPGKIDERPPILASTPTNPPVLAAAATNPPAQVPVKPNAEPPPEKLEVVKLTNEPPPKLPEDIAPAPTPPANNVVVAVEPDNSVTNSPPALPLPPISSKVKPRNEGRGLLDRLNPRTWFGGKETPVSALPPKQVKPGVTTSPAIESPSLGNAVPPPRSAAPPPPAPVSIARYSYRQPDKPAAGDRGKALPIFAEGLNAHRERRLAAAIAAYREALKLDPSFYQANYNLGLAAYEVKDLGQSLIAYEYALAIEPETGDASSASILAIAPDSTVLYRTTIIDP